jgi:hypothetical protein
MHTRRHHYVLMASWLAVMLGTILWPSREGRAAAAKAPTFADLRKCKEYHDTIYATWRQTVHAKGMAGFFW